jgi:hypothetical protein
MLQLIGGTKGLKMKHLQTIRSGNLIAEDRSNSSHLHSRVY